MITYALCNLHSNFIKIPAKLGQIRKLFHIFEALKLRLTGLTALCETILNLVLGYNLYKKN